MPGFVGRALEYVSELDAESSQVNGLYLSVSVFGRDGMTMVIICLLFPSSAALPPPHFLVSMLTPPQTQNSDRLTWRSWLDAFRLRAAVDGHR